MIKKLLFITILFAGVLILAPAVSAANPFADIEYPVEELGNCQDREECKAFCDVPENLNACLDFASQAGLISQEDAEIARKLEGKVGPGGCEGMEQCELYCEDMDHLDECLAFAEENDILSDDELEEMKKISKAIKGGLKPPCQSKRECDEVCMKPENMEQCMEFAEAAGLMPEHEREEAKKFLQAIKNGAIPPDCNGPEECDIYCGKPENMLECTEFAIAAGFVPPEEAEDMKASLVAMRKGIMPPDCRSREECDAYCSEEEHVEECMAFSVAAGFMTQEQADGFTKTGGKGPGGCVGESECYEFCGNPNNVEVCLDFGVMMGEMTQEEADRIRQEIKEGRGSGHQGGPGGCTTQEECEIFCSKPENIEECSRMGPDEDPGMGGGFDDGPKHGPDCSTPEECESFCQNPANAIDCVWMQVGKGEITEQEAKAKEQAIMMERGEWGEPNEQFRDGPPPEGEWKEGDHQSEFDEQYNKQFEGQYQDEFQKQYDEEFQGQYDDQFEGQYQDNRYIPGEHDEEGWQEGSEPSFTPEGINNIIHNVDEALREGIIINELGPDNAYPDQQHEDGSQWQSDDQWQDTGEWQDGNQDGTGGDWNDSTTGGQDGQTDSWREPEPAYDSDYQDSIYQESTGDQQPHDGFESISESNPQPMPGPNEPISESNPQPMPAPEQTYNEPQPTYNEPAPTYNEPAPTYNEPPPTQEPPTGSLIRFVGNILRFIWGD